MPATETETSAFCNFGIVSSMRWCQAGLMTTIQRPASVDGRVVPGGVVRSGAAATGGMAPCHRGRCRPGFQQLIPGAVDDWPLAGADGDVAIVRWHGTAGQRLALLEAPSVGAIILPNPTPGSDRMAPGQAVPGVAKPGWTAANPPRTVHPLRRPAGSRRGVPARCSSPAELVRRRPDRLESRPPSPAPD